MGKGRATTRGIRLVIIGLVASIGLLSAASVNAQTEVTIEPAQLTVTAVRGINVEPQKIFLRTATPIKNFQPITLDLKRADGSAVLPAEAIFVQKALVSPTKPNQLTALVGFNLQKVFNSGEFSGKLLLSYETGEQVIPVTVRVKDHWLLPLIVLLIGTGLGVGVSIYRAQGKPRDELLIRVSQLRTQMQEEDLTKAGAFQSRGEDYLVEVKIALQAERWEEAQSAVKQAEIVWSKWLKGRTDWLAQLAYCEEINQRLQGLQQLNPSISYVVQTLRRHLEDAVRDAPDLDSPRQLRDRIEEIAQQINRYIQLQTKIEQLKSLSTQLSADLAKSWQSKAKDFEQQLGNLQPSDVSEEAKFSSEVDKLEKALTELTELVSHQSGIGATAKALPKLGLTISLLAPAPSARALTWEELAKSATQRLQAFTLFSYLIAILFLAGAGFSELYVDQPTFGANPWKDYFALLAWGFGAEATRDAITKVIQGWGLPGLNRT